MLHSSPSYLWGLDAVLGRFSEVVIDSSMVTRALNGAPIPENAVAKPSGKISEESMEYEVFRVKAPDGQLLGLGKFSQMGRTLTFVKVFSSLNN